MANTGKEKNYLKLNVSIQVLLLLFVCWFAQVDPSMTIYLRNINRKKKKREFKEQTRIFTKMPVSIFGGQC